MTAVRSPIASPIRAGLRSPFPAATSRAQTLDLDPLFRGSTLDADFASGGLRLWVNDPPYADRVGRWRHGPALPDKSSAEVWALSRASKAWDFDSLGALTELANDGLRVGYSAPGVPAGFLMESSGTNQARNPRGEFAAAPAFPQSTLPTNWLATGSGLSVTAVGAGTEAGIPYVDIRFSGTAAAASFTLSTETQGVAAATGQAWTQSAYIRRIAGAAPDAERVVFRQRDNAAAQLGDLTAIVPISSVGSLAQCRVSASATLNQAATASLTGFIQFSIGIGAAVEVTYRVGGFQLEQYPFPTSLILPPIGAPAISTRSADSLRIDGTAFLALDIAREGSLIVEAQMDAIGDGLFRIFAALSDAAGTSRIEVRPTQAHNSYAVIPAGGSGGPTMTFGFPAFGVPQRIAIRWGPSGIAGCANGGGVLSNAYRFNNAFTRLFIGSPHTGVASSLGGRIRLVRALNYAAPDAELRARSVVGA